ncbi:MAG: CDP-diglyceride synthetase [Bdellovibrio sp. CG12_big_fil_rev_8_21_14_0_65_39_13]|nr:MAG: CDP-diglyceride synthetase [Bdellovibrio sp. CG22_combo_CG10-13_8_21_14_all_39_27]PIQ58351.1 MAG: CDP-diglyceride synthetase [Bdellovibrio sp. CG12_big_fil_rev_8_21_14_0_65_39_13]PIR35864.1 MAG: CDP-diglyceride synthetase [Bdellovibrio sp. CG11_big_fil_rev_8_21_14_0_20_39_38]PJB54326.1 MAG: CDP-archaeol synthase [Bdellovibrio sp. CG_4_9_14_3_um_filter_39_7]
MLLTFWKAYLLSFPLMIGGIIHMIAVKKDWLSFLKIPIHKWTFGKNKTWRGFIIMPLGTLLGIFPVALLDNLISQVQRIGIYEHWVLFGLGLGFSYVLFELPNSFIKRRLGVEPGKTSEKNKKLFFVLDHIDSGLGVSLFYYFFVTPDAPLILLGVTIGAFVHTATNVALYKFGIRKEKL